MIGALAPAIPEAAVGAANGANTTAVFFGHDPRHDRDYVYLETLGGGFGGRFTKDGKDGVQVHITNTSNLPVESIEMEYPLLVESYGFVEDSGGAGKYRGGLGLRRVVRPVGHTMTFSGQGERFVNRPWGLFGGGSGGTGKFVKLSGGAEVPLPTKPANLEVKANEAIVVETPGAGGYGKPQRARQGRDRERFRVGQVFARLHQGSLRRGAEEAMSYDAIVIGAGISGAATAYHLRKSGAEDPAARAGRAGERRHGKKRRDHPPELFDAPARSPGARQHHDVRECTRPSSARTPASCRTAIASSSRPTCWTARRRTSRCRRGLGIVNEWSEGPGFPQHLPEINPDGIAGIVYEPHGGYADPVQATEAYVDAFRNAGGEFRARTPVRRLLRRATASPASSSTTAISPRAMS